MKKVITSVLVALCLGTSAQSLTSKQRDFINEVESQGYVRCECTSNSIYIKGRLWNAIPYKTKETLGAMYSIKCANERSNSLYYVNIYDYFSGRKLAKFSRVYGFDVY